MWLDFDEVYAVSSDGEVKNKVTSKILKPIKSGSYFLIKLHSKPYRIHRLVGLLFFPYIPVNVEIDHINRNSFDNRAANLRWVSKSENNMNRNPSKSARSNTGEKYITKNGNRYCLQIQKRKERLVKWFSTLEEAKEARKFYLEDIDAIPNPSKS